FIEPSSANMPTSGKVARPQSIAYSSTAGACSVVCPHAANIANAATDIISFFMDRVLPLGAVQASELPKRKRRVRMITTRTRQTAFASVTGHEPLNAPYVVQQAKPIVVTAYIRSETLSASRSFSILMICGTKLAIEHKPATTPNVLINQSGAPSIRRA